MLRHRTSNKSNFVRNAIASVALLGASFTAGAVTTIRSVDMPAEQRMAIISNAADLGAETICRNFDSIKIKETNCKCYSKKEEETNQEYLERLLEIIDVTKISDENKKRLVEKMQTTVGETVNTTRKILEEIQTEFMQLIGGHVWIIRDGGKIIRNGIEYEVKIGTPYREKYGKFSTPRIFSNVKFSYIGKVFSVSTHLPEQEVVGDIPEPGHKKRKETETWMEKIRKKAGKYIDGIFAKLNPQMHALDYQTNRIPDCSANIGGDYLGRGQCIPELRRITEEEYNAGKIARKVAKIDTTTNATTTTNNNPE